MLLCPLTRMDHDKAQGLPHDPSLIVLYLHLPDFAGTLNAYIRKNKTRRALWDYSHIIRSVYLWDYIDSPPLRQHVQRALNRGEDYHQLRRAVSYANVGKLRFKTEHAQQPWGNVRVC